MTTQYIPQGYPLWAAYSLSDAQIREPGPAYLELVIGWCIPGDHDGPVDPPEPIRPITTSEWCHDPLGHDAAQIGEDLPMGPLIAYGLTPEDADGNYERLARPRRATAHAG